MLLPRKQITWSVLIRQLSVPVTCLAVAAIFPGSWAFSIIGGIIGTLWLLIEGAPYIHYRDLSWYIDPILAATCDNQEMQEMQEMSLRNGRWGVLFLTGIGLYWEPDFYTKADEIIRKAKVDRSHRSA